MMHTKISFAIYILNIVHLCDAFAPAYQSRTILTTHISSVANVGEQSTTKSKFIDALDQPFDRITKGSTTRTQLLNDVINEKGGLPNPGSRESFASVAEGVWRVVYAPHMTFMSGLARGEFSVQVSLLFIILFLSISQYVLISHVMYIQYAPHT